MKQILITLMCLCFAGVVYAQTQYPVQVQVNETTNRTLLCTVRNHVVVVDQPKQFGADDKGPTPPELLAMSYGSCIVSTIQFLAMQQHKTVSNIQVTINGTIDFAKAMSLTTTARAGFKSLSAQISFNSDMTTDEKQALLKHVFEVGAAIDNIANQTPISYQIQ